MFALQSCSFPLRRVFCVQNTIREAHLSAVLYMCRDVWIIILFWKEADWIWILVHVRSLSRSIQLMCKCHRQKLFAYTLLSLLILQRNVRRDQRNQRYPAGGMQSLSKNQNRQKFSRKMQRNYGRGQWNDRKPAVSVYVRWNSWDLNWKYY